MPRHPNHVFTAEERARGASKGGRAYAERLTKLRLSEFFEQLAGTTCAKHDSYNRKISRPKNIVDSLWLCINKLEEAAQRENTTAAWKLAFDASLRVAQLEARLSKQSAKDKAIAEQARRDAAEEEYQKFRLAERFKEIERQREESEKQRAIAQLSATLAGELNKLDEQVEVLSPLSVPQLSNPIEAPNMGALSLVEPQSPMRAESRDPAMPDGAIRPYNDARGKLAGWVMPGGLLTDGEEWISWLPVR
jgi:hypothetical protein